MNASAALFYNINALNGQTLLLADENFDAATIPQNLDISAISNRFDIVQLLQSRHVSTEFSDFDCSHYPDKSIDTILMRLPKSKALIYHLLGEIKRMLKVGGSLIITGHNDEGIQNIVKKSSAFMGFTAEQKLLGKGLRYACITALLAPKLEQLEDRFYTQSQLIKTDDETIFYSKPGIYGFNKIDEGSQFLVEHIKASAIPSPKTLLDLGCGYGFLSVVLGKHYNVPILATDNNAAAIQLCSQNLLKNHIEGRAFADDCALSLADRSIDLIVCNPPFHQGFETSKALTEKFLLATKRLLTKKGSAWFVVNRFIAIEGVCDELSINYEIIAENSQFKVLKITG